MPNDDNQDLIPQKERKNPGFLSRLREKTHNNQRLIDTADRIMGEVEELVTSHVKTEITRFNDNLTDFAEKRMDEVIEQKISAITTQTAQAMIQEQAIGVWRIRELIEEALQPIKREQQLLSARISQLELMNAGARRIEGGN